jgi:hypothetical protein
MIIGYTCCICGGEHPATPADIAAAQAACGTLVTDAEAFLDYGRDVCPRCTMRNLLLTLDRASTAPLFGRHGGLIS